MTIDLVSLWMIVGLTAFLSGIANTVIRFSNLQLEGISYWAGFSYLFAIGIMLSSTIGINGNPTYAFIPNLMFITAFTSLYLGVRESCMKSGHPWLMISGIWVVGVCMVYFATSVTPDNGLRLNIFNLYVALLCGMSAWQLYRNLARDHKGQISLLVLLVGVVIFMIIKSFYQASYDYQIGGESYTQWLVATGLLMQISLIWFIFSVVLISAEHLQDELIQCGYRDVLTGLLNDTGMEETAKRVLRRCQRTQTPVMLMMIDVDFFRDMNDVYGYEFSNGVLQEVAKTITQTLRFEDYSARYQSDVFVTLHEGASESDQLIPAQRLLHSFEEKDLNINGTLVPCTVSVGIATSTGDLDFYDLIDLANEALQEVKGKGGNSIKVYQDNS